MLTRAVVMAGGTGSRLYPLTTAVNKHMLPVYDRPMIQHVIESVVSWGITDILVLLNYHFAQPIMELLEDGSSFGCSITYGYQREVVSPGKHLTVARSFACNEPFLLICGDSLYLEPLSFTEESYPRMWAMPLEGFDDFRKYAEVELTDGRVFSMTEKPQTLSSGIIQTGAWAFDADVFDRADRLLHTTEGELQIRVIVQEYVREGRMHASLLPPRSFLDLGTPEALYRGAGLVRDRAYARAKAAE